MPRTAEHTKREQVTSDIRLVSKSALKETLKNEGLRVSQDVLENVDKVMYDVLKRAAGRCKANGRATVRMEDF